MKEEIHVLGAGMSAFGFHAELQLEDLILEAALEALWDTGEGLSSIDGAWLATTTGPEREPGALTQALGLSEIPVSVVTGGATCGGDAVRAAVLALLSGEHSRVLVVGAECRGAPPTSGPGAHGPAGISNVGVAGLFARRMMEHGQVTMAHLDAILVKNRMHGQANPKAYRKSRLTMEDIEGSSLVADPLREVDVAPVVDGAAALILSRGRPPEGAPARPVRLLGMGYSVTAGDVVQFFDAKTDFSGRTAPRAACFHAYAEAGIVNPWSQVSLAEADDASTISELLSYEDLALCDAGQAADVVEQGSTALGGAMPVNPSGGNLSCGTAPGADIPRRFYEVVRQLQGRAGPRQIQGAKVGVVHGCSLTGNVGFVAVLGMEEGGA